MSAVSSATVCRVVLDARSDMWRSYCRHPLCWAGLEELEVSNAYSSHRDRR
jgi:hypothetical protein